MRDDATSPAPATRLRVVDAAAIIVGVVLGVAIFRAPALGASGVDSALGFVGLWLLGGALSLVGALYDAELATRLPGRAGTYPFLRPAFGRNVAFLLAWARLTAIGTGSLALLVLVLGAVGTRGIADTVGIDLAQTFAGPVAALAVAALISLAVIASMNGPIRSALARDSRRYC